MDFEGRHAIVTGGAAGIGKAVAQRLVASGAQVIIGDIDYAKAQETAADIEPSTQRCQAYPLDLADMDSIDTFVAST